MNTALSPRPTQEVETLQDTDLRETPGLPARVDLLGHLEGLCADRGQEKLAHRLGELMDFVGADLASFEAELAGLPRYPAAVTRGAQHLVDLGGKRLRPICVALASRLGNMNGDRDLARRVLDLGVAAELVHSATLLHDDVVDLAETRRGVTTARLIYGNAASVFAGDWLLIEALRRVQRSAPEMMGSLFETIEEMILAESLQLENRGRISTERDVYFRVVKGKTAALFRWAMQAGGHAGRLREEEVLVLGDYGVHIGIAFQATDDLLDLTGDVAHTGKELFTDLREGKMTYPVIVALERDPALRPLVEEIVQADLEEPVPEALGREVIDILRRTRAVEDCMELARERSACAVHCLERLPQNHANRSLATVAEAIVDRDL